jgi:hypothetical protein
MRKILFFVLLPALIFAGCQQQQLVGNDRDIHGCIGSAGYSWCEAKQKCLRVWEEPCQNETVPYQNITKTKLSADDAIAVAKASDCIKEGNLTGRPMYEEHTRKWWITMDRVRLGCKATCAVSEENKTAKVEWRCGGPVSA